MPAEPRLEGLLHLFVAFDWAEVANLETAKQLASAELRSLPRRARTPASIEYQVPPLRIELPDVSLPSPLARAAAVDLTVFDFGAVSAAAHLPFAGTGAELRELAGRLSEADELVAAIRGAVEPLFHKLKPALTKPAFSDKIEEYFVFQFPPRAEGPDPPRWLEHDAAWLAGLVRLDSDPLSDGEVDDALRLRISYSPRDLIVADWAAAVLIDDNCDDVLDVIALANLQLLEFRHLDAYLTSRMQEAERLLERVASAWLPFWRTHTRPLRALGELKLEVNILLERSTDVLTLVGDQYLARVYRLLETRLHLREWSDNLRRSIGLLESIYRTVSDQAATYRMELLELIIVVLILFEIVMALVK